MKRTTLLLAALFISFSLAACRNSPPTLSLLVWEGYADPSFVHGFEISHHCKVVASYMGSSDELVAKLRGGSAANYDVISPSSDVAASIVKAGLAARSVQNSFLWAAIGQPSRFFSRQGKRPGFRRPVHVGTQFTALRHQRVSAAA